ncbi:hypothetical protein QEN19_000216 [Hanseniaspora menglaensis]
MENTNEKITKIILVVAEIVKNTTIFNEIIYAYDADEVVEKMSVQSTLDRYLENLKNIDMLAEDTKKYTINSKYIEGNYTNIESFYKDFSIVCFILLNTLNKFSESYYLVDKIFQIVSELILRSLTVDIGNLVDEETFIQNEKELQIPKPLFKSFEIQFKSIAEFYKVPVKKQLQIEVQLGNNVITRNGMGVNNTNNHNSNGTLFSSILNKSILDRREDELPDENMSFVKVLPVDISSTMDASKLGLIIPSTNKRIPDPTLPATRILTKYINPLWYKLPVNIWLKNLVPDDDNDKLEHVLPIVSKNESLISNCKASDLWIKKTDYLVHYNKKQEELKKQEEESDLSENLQLETFSKTLLTKKHTPLTSDDDNNKINLNNLMTWSESHYYSDFELETLINCDSLKKVQDLISKYMAKLIVLQKSRIKSKTLLKPQLAETELYHKIKNLLKLILLYSSKEEIKKLEIKTTTTVPVLQSNYSGSLPMKKFIASASTLNYNSATSHAYSSSGKYRPKKYRKI